MVFFQQPLPVVPGRARGSRGRPVLVAALASTLVAGLSPTAQAQEARYRASTTVFSDLTHIRTDSADDTRGSLGIRGDVGAQVQSGAHNFNGAYGATLETEQSSLARGDDDAASVRGASRYSFFEPGNRFDFNAGHTIRTVRNDTGFIIDPDNYDTQNAISAGAGVMFYPSALTTLRLSGQAGKTFEQDDLPDSESANASASLSRRMTERTSASVSAGRTWELDSANDLTLDTAQLGIDTRLENGSFSISGGVSRAENNNFENEAVIGSVARTWAGENSSTRLSADRTQTSTALDLALAPMPELGLEDEFSIRLKGLTVRNSVTLSHTTRQQLCSLCSVQLIASGAEEEEIETGIERWDYLLGAGLGLEVDRLRTLDFNYQWHGDAFGERSEIDDEVHRFRITYRRQLTRLASWGASVATAVTRGVSDRERAEARVFFTYGWDGLDRF